MVSSEKRRYNELKSKVIALRKQGKTHSEIRAIYNIPKSTLSNWLHNLKFSPKIETIIKKRGYEKWLENNRLNAQRRAKKWAEMRENWRNEGLKEVKNVATALYWVEGSMKNRNSLRFGNSNPLIINMIMQYY